MKLLLREGIVVFFVYFIICYLSESAVAGSALRGVSPKDLKIFHSRGVIKCRDGSKIFTIDQLNDDFCDCLDATDEPGTSACPNGKFYCQNTGHVPLSIFSSRVNDGVCDCCDGSDEYDGKVNCINTCWEAGEVTRKKLMKKIETHRGGISLRKQEILEARLALSKDEAELTKLKREEKILNGLVQQLKDRKEQIEKAEEKERLLKEKEDSEKKEAEEKSNMNKSEIEKNFDQEISEGGENIEQQNNKTMETPNDNKIGHLEVSSMDQAIGMTENVKDSAVETEHGDHSGSEESFQNSVNSKDESKDVELSSEELGHQESKDAELSRGRQIANDGTSEEIDHEETTEENRDEEDDTYGSEADDGRSYNDADGDNGVDDDGYDDDDGDDDDNGSGIDDLSEDKENHKQDIEDHTKDIEENHDYSTYMSDSESDFISSDLQFSRNQTWLEKIQKTVRTILQAVNLFQTPVDKSEAALVRKEYDESSARLSKMQSKISRLTEKLKNDFGREKEFYLFYGRCFESKQNKYVYKVCPFKKASQVEGHSTTQLGQWEKFEDSYKVMLFSNGNSCWNGPDRSLRVRLRCGLKSELTDVDEPSRCEYEALLFTPMVCMEEKVKELQQKLEELNKEAPPGRDEL